jgi:hypothetical protein
MRLAFFARSTTAEANDEVASCGFDGERGKAFGIMSENGALVRIAWFDGQEGEDEGIVGLTFVELWSGRISLSFDRASGSVTRIPYEGVDITYEDVDDRSTDLADVFSRLLAAQPERVRIHREPPPPPSGPISSA